MKVVQSPKESRVCFRWYQKRAGFVIQKGHYSTELRRFLQGRVKPGIKIGMRLMNHPNRFNN